jgi:hypothetical protein
MYVGDDFPVVSPNDSRLYSLDFVRDVASTEIINSATAVLEVDTEHSDPGFVDGSPASHMQGGPIINGTIVSQRLSGLLSGGVYLLRMIANTSQGNAPELFTHVRSRAPA